ncbi:unnamed protein product [Lymnaea stagnalis]|uniref:Uncharacterized protein n=1 Tax=Lymnaea stagnalis TaxID=6523 RepID=A0AAV2HEE4_LYMST
MAQPFTVVGTWTFSQAPALEAAKRLAYGHSALDAVEAGITIAEVDPTYGPYHVGCAGWRNSNNVLELDAAIMDGKQLSFGAVTALQGFPQAISVARQVMEKSRHSILTGSGAALFAESHGFKYQPNLGVNSPCGEPSSLAQVQCAGHDTLGLLALDGTGNICAGVSTSGMSGKHPGRVGDSTLPGCGLYADSLYGAACCSGDGDEILKFCPSYKVVDLLKQGKNPQEACQLVTNEISQHRGWKARFQLVIIAIDAKGQTGAGNLGVDTWTDCNTGKMYPGFPYTLRSHQDDDVLVQVVPSMTH